MTSNPDTRERLLEAFADSLLEGPYERLSVSALLRRAGVGRTSFYVHFADKEALFAASVQRLSDFIAQQVRAEAAAWAFVAPFLRHVDSHRTIYNGFVGRESAAVLERHLQRAFARWLNDDLARRGGRPALDVIEQAAAAGVIWAVLVAWIERRIELGPDGLAEQLSGRLDRLLGEPPR